MIDIEKLSSEELVSICADKGLTTQIRGKTVEDVREILKKNMVESTNTEDIASLPQDDSLGSLSWVDIKKLAKENGIKVFKKKRSEIEVLLTEVLTKEETKEAVVSKPEIEKIVKKVEKKEIDTTLKIKESEWRMAIDSIIRIEQRIDRIVARRSQSKSVKGL